MFFFVTGAYGAAALMSLLSFAGAVTYSAFGALFPKRPVSSFLDYTCLTVAAAAMIGDACLHMIPETFEGADAARAETYGLLLIAGVVAVLAFEGLCDALRGADATIRPFGVANLLVEGLHNFADGMALGVAWRLSPEAGAATTVAVAVHELPQELGDFAVLKRAGFSVPGLLAANFLASLTCFGGVAFAAAPLVVEREDELVAFTAGTFLALSLYSLAPQALETLRDIRGTAARSLASAWCLLLVASVVRFLLFITELESAVPAHTEL